jgi:5-oxoprolinase (ATP-hydrolysing)
VGQASSLPGGLEARPTLSSGPTLSSPASGGGPLFYVASRAHHAEIGGAAPGSMPPFSRNLAEEGVVVDAFLLARGGRSREAEVRALLAAGPHPSRRIDENIADLHAQVAANQTGATLLSDTLASLGVEHVTQYMLHVREAAERKMRQAISRLKDGRYSFRDALDDGSPLAVAIDVAGDAARVDFTGTGPVLPGNLNANRAIVASAVLYCFRCLIDEDIPLNAGVLAPIDIVLPECFLNPPRFDEPSRCAAVAGGNVETSQRIVDAIFGALGVVAAGQGTMNNVIFGDRNFGYYETIGGGSGAGPGFDGADAVHTHMTNTRLTDPEVLEDRYPVRLRRFAIRRGSGGAGRYRGGDGMIREIEFLAPLELSLLTQRRLRQPYGLAGGAPGAVGRNTLMRAGGEQAGDDQTAGVELPPIAHAMIQPGDILRIETPGGGGYGTTCARPSNSAEPA